MDQDDEQKYRSFISTMPHAMLYHGWEYMEFSKGLVGGNDHYLIALNKEDNIEGVLPLIYKEGSLGRVYNSLPFYGSNGGVLANDQECFDFIIENYNRFVEDTDFAASTVITNPLRPSDNYEGIASNYKDYRIGQFSSILFSDDHENKLMDSFHYKTRNVIRKAVKEGVEVSIDNSAIDFLYNTHVNNMTAIGGKPKPKAFYENFPSYYQAGKDYNIYLASFQSEPIAAMLVFYFNGTVEYYTPVIVEKYRSMQPLSLLIYHAMIDASKIGYVRWNWGGTWASQDGVYSFKKRWGTYDINYYYYTQLKNSDILKASRKEILDQYNNFFVISFDQLKSL
ncbi:MAG: peptidoglycan bridge formation glycyltransferase FemA/FemB family protein [Chitinophagia bacterium]|jgi:hypothetical protein